MIENRISTLHQWSSNMDAIPIVGSPSFCVKALAYLRQLPARPGFKALHRPLTSTVLHSFSHKVRESRFRGKKCWDPICVNTECIRFSYFLCKSDDFQRKYGCISLQIGDGSITGQAGPHHEVGNSKLTQCRRQVGPVSLVGSL